MRKIFFLILISSLGSMLFAQPHWETMVGAHHTWSYLLGNSQAPAGWYTNGYNDDTWNSANGSFGFGDEDDATILDITHSLYIRNTFSIVDKSIIDSLILDIDYDDAYVVYLNGTMVSRSFNVETDFPPYNYTPTIGQEAVMYKGGQPSRVAIPKSHLLNGENVLAIQGINVSPTSSDFSLAPFLQVKIDAAGIVYEDVPDWFADPDAVFESNLPIIVIETANGQSVPDEPKIDAHMGIVDNESGINGFPGTFNGYDGKIGIELRGQTSKGFPKKGYGLETRLESGENNNVSLLGMPPENDWILHGPYSDKSLIRNVLAYHFAREMGQYAPRTRLCELFLNNAYSGVYVLVEKIKRDTFRVDVGKLTPDEISDRGLTGGYIFKIDKGSEPYWTSPYLSINDNDINFLYHYPDHDLMPVVQRDYIKDFVTDFEDALAGPQYLDPVLGYKPYIDMKSFVDFYLANEIAKNVDSYRISTYLHKDKDKKDAVSPIKAGPIWDFNLGFGNANYFEGSVISGWQSENPADDRSTPFWWARFKEDPEYYMLLENSWKTYRGTILSDTRVVSVIDSLSTLLADAQQRNFAAYAILNDTIWPNNYVGGTYENEIIYLKNWISDRMAWIDSQLGEAELPNSIYANMEPAGMDLKIFPNPVDKQFSMALNVDWGSELRIEVINVLAQTTYQASYDLAMGSQIIRFGADMVDMAMPQSGIYILNLHVDGKFLGARKIVKK